VSSLRWVGGCSAGTDLGGDRVGSRPQRCRSGRGPCGDAHPADGPRGNARLHPHRTPSSSSGLMSRRVRAADLRARRAGRGSRGPLVVAGRAAVAEAAVGDTSSPAPPADGQPGHHRRSRSPNAHIHNCVEIAGESVADSCAGRVAVPVEIADPCFTLGAWPPDGRCHRSRKDRRAAHGRERTAGVAAQVQVVDLVGQALAGAVRDRD
jgi:hypothetical protein